MNLFNRIANKLTKTTDTQKDGFFNSQKWESFTFGDAEKVLDKRQLTDLFQSYHNGNYYEPQVSLSGLYKSFEATPYHSSGILVKRNILASTLIPNKYITHLEFEKAVLDSMIFANGYFRRVESRTGKLLKLEYVPSMHTRRMKQTDKYCYIGKPGTIHEYEAGEIFHYIEHDAKQEIYGRPEYMSALQSAWLNESATLFRRRYYDNGTHAGFIMYITDQAHKEEDINNIRTSLKQSRGPGNFRNLLMYAPGGKKDGMQILPISETTAKDEFFNIKDISRDDILAAHRVPQQLMSIPAKNTAGHGSPEAAAKVFYVNEIIPLQKRWKAINAWLGMDVINFEPYSLALDLDT